jgi:cytochrome c553
MKNDAATPLFQNSHEILICVSYLLILWTPQVVLAAPLVLPEPGNQAMKLKEKDLEVRERFAAMVEKIQKNRDIEKKIIRMGQERTIFCNVCHGKDGNAVRPGVPNLADQNPVYLLDQFQRFSDGRRYDRGMTQLSETFTEDEKVLLALYYSSLKVQPTEINDSEYALRGKKIYDVACAQCHGENGRGEKGYAHLAGQKSDYVLKMLKEFRSYTGRRANPWMTVVTNSLSEEQMSNVAIYISTLK